MQTTVGYILASFLLNMDKVVLVLVTVDFFSFCIFSRRVLKTMLFSLPSVFLGNQLQSLLWHCTASPRTGCQI